VGVFSQRQKLFSILHFFTLSQFFVSQHLAPNFGDQVKHSLQKPLRAACPRRSPRLLVVRVISAEPLLVL
jgi:hypothetical protein